MRKLILILALWLACLPAQAAADPAAGFLAGIPLARKACLDKAQPEWDTGVTMRVIAASQAYADCLQELIETLAGHFYPPDAFGAGGIKARLQAARKEVTSLYFAINTQPLHCRPTCGTMWNMLSASAEADFLEKTLLEMSERVAVDDEALEAIVNEAWKKCWREPEHCGKAKTPH